MHHCALYCRRHGDGAAALYDALLPYVLLLRLLNLLLLHGLVALHAHVHVHDLALTKPQTHAGNFLQAAALQLAPVLCKLPHVQLGSPLHVVPLVCQPPLPA
jgi:hypothetical protein